MTRKTTLIIKTDLIINVTYALYREAHAVTSADQRAYRESIR